MNKKYNCINENIKAKEINLIGINNEKMGIINKFEGIKIAKLNNLDLVEINSNIIPPICKIMNYNKFIYKKNKKLKKQKKKNKY